MSEFKKALMKDEFFKAEVKIRNSIESLRVKQLDRIKLSENTDDKSENFVRENQLDLNDPADRMRAQIESNKDRVVGTSPLYESQLVAKVIDKKTIFDPDVKVHMGSLMIGMFVFLVLCLTIALCS